MWTIWTAFCQGFQDQAQQKLESFARLMLAPGRLWLEGGRDKQKLDALVVAEVLAVGKGARKKSSL